MCTEGYQAPESATYQTDWAPDARDAERFAAQPSTVHQSSIMSAPDHPHEFARGTDDGGAAAPPAPAPAPARRAPAVDDAALAYHAAAAFDGARPGFVFKLGARGLGYYEDAPAA